MSQKRKSEEYSWLLYGANGYTGQLIAERAASLGMQPVLAGRNTEKIAALGQKLGLPFRIFDVHSIDQKDLEGVSLVLNCAGPFSQTAGPWIDACLAHHLHYLDITGEMEVFAQIYARHEEAKQAGLSFIPGVGFDIVPTDCLSLRLKEKLPTATHLELAFKSGGGVSPGTLKTMIENLPKGGILRRNGKLVYSPFGSPVKNIPFQSGKRWAAAIPWGDVFTAFYTTGIPNITVYMVMPLPVLIFLKLAGGLLPTLARPKIVERLKQLVEQKISGPSEEILTTRKTVVWGRVSDGSNEATLEWIGPEGYEFTRMMALKAVQKILSGRTPPGAMTPAMAWGQSLLDIQ